jgi:hypothetical protein
MLSFLLRRRLFPWCLQFGKPNIPRNYFGMLRIDRKQDEAVGYASMPWGDELVSRASSCFYPLTEVPFYC